MQPETNRPITRPLPGTWRDTLRRMGGRLIEHSDNPDTDCPTMVAVLRQTADLLEADEAVKRKVDAA